MTEPEEAIKKLYKLIECSGGDAKRKLTFFFPLSILENYTKFSFQFTITSLISDSPDCLSELSKQMRMDNSRSWISSFIAVELKGYGRHIIFKSGGRILHKEVFFLHPPFWNFSCATTKKLLPVWHAAATAAARSRSTFYPIDFRNCNSRLVKTILAREGLTAREEVSPREGRLPDTGKSNDYSQSIFNFRSAKKAAIFNFKAK